MPDLNERLRGIDRLSPPDLWSVARAKAEDGSAVASDPSGWRRAALIAASLAVGLGAVAWVMVAVRTTSSPPVPSAQPIVSPASRGDCQVGLLVRSSPVGTTEFVRLMEGYLPTWMPQGFGLLASYGPERSADGLGGYGVWSDDRCRVVELTFNSTGRSSAPLPGDLRPSVGPWKVDADVPGGCSNGVLGRARCLDYSAATPDGSLVLKMMGLDRDEGDRIALSIYSGVGTQTPTPSPSVSPVSVPDVLAQTSIDQGPTLVVDHGGTSVPIEDGGSRSYTVPTGTRILVGGTAETIAWGWGTGADPYDKPTPIGREIPIVVEGRAGEHLLLRLKAEWVDGAVGEWTLRLAVTVPSKAELTLACPPDQRVKFHHSGGVILPGGSAFIRGNVQGLTAQDAVAQVTWTSGRNNWDGLWAVYRRGSLIALIRFDDLSGVACAGTGVEGA